MLQLSYWAKANPAKARLLIILLHVCLMYLTLLISSLLAQTNFSLDSRISNSLILVACCILIAYPFENTKRNFKKRKIMSVLMLSSAFMLLIGIFSSTFREVPPTYRSNDYQVIQIVHKQKKAKQATFFQKIKRTANAKWTQVKAHFQYVGKEIAPVIGIVLGVIILAFILLMIFLFASDLICAITCSSGFPWALIIGLTGAATCIVGAFFAVRLIAKSIKTGIQNNKLRRIQRRQKKG